jgi:lysophospholipase L1-like esterase
VRAGSPAAAGFSLKGLAGSVEVCFMSRQRPRPPGGSRLAAKVGLAVLAVAVAVLAVQSLRPTPAPADTTPAWTPTPTPTRALVAFLGDSYTGGSHMGGNGATGWPALLSAAKGWRFQLYAVGGSGFVSPGSGNSTFAQRVPAIIAAGPSIVFVEGGHNDLGKNPEPAIITTIDELRAGLPSAQIIVLSPIWPNSHPPAALTPIADALRTEAAKVRAVYVDTSGWFAGPYSSLIGSDGTHPTDAGHRRIAQQLGGRL